MEKKYLKIVSNLSCQIVSKFSPICLHGVKNVSDLSQICLQFVSMEKKNVSDLSQICLHGDKILSDLSQNYLTAYFTGKNNLSQNCLKIVSEFVSWLSMRKTLSQICPKFVSNLSLSQPFGFNKKLSA